jgi:hypothetical protein
MLATWISKIGRCRLVNMAGVYVTFSFTVCRLWCVTIGLCCNLLYDCKITVDATVCSVGNAVRCDTYVVCHKTSRYL